MKSLATIVWSTLLLLCVSTASVTAADSLTISAAASTTDALKEMIASYQKSHPDLRVQPNFASSGSLAKQIEQGAQADIYISANPKWMKYLVDQGKIAADSQTILATNSLVFVGQPRPTPLSMEQLTSLKSIAIGSPKSVPAGQYAQQALTATGQYDALLQAGKLVMAKDVRQALIYADRGETEGAFVYRTDARLAEQATILFTVPQELYNTVTYPVALTVSGQDKAAARDLLAYLTGPEAAGILESYGFTPAGN